jgi:NaMN:DMB phosphoribosyltransferase
MQKGVVLLDGGIQGLFVYICLQAGCSPPANSFWPLGHPIPSPHFTYEAGGAGIQLQHNYNLLCYKKTLENLVTSSSSLKKEAKSQVVKQVARAGSLREIITTGKLDHHHHGLTL